MSSLNCFSYFLYLLHLNNSSKYNIISTYSDPYKKVFLFNSRDRVVSYKRHRSLGHYCATQNQFLIYFKVQFMHIVRFWFVLNDDVITFRSVSEISNVDV